MKKPIIWNGVKYPSIAAAAKALGLARNTVRYRAQQGYTRDEDMKYQWGTRDRTKQRRAFQKILERL